MMIVKTIKASSTAISAGKNALIAINKLLINPPEINNGALFCEALFCEALFCHNHFP